MRERERYYTEALSNDKACLKGWAAVISIGSANPSVKRIAIITRKINDTNFLESFFNNANAPKLFGKLDFGVNYDYTKAETSWLYSVTPVGARVQIHY